MTEAGNTGVLVAAVVAGRSLREVAAMAGLSITTVQRRLKDAEVIAEIRQERSRQRQETLGQFSELRTASIERLRLLLDDSQSSVALRAISLILTTSSRLDMVHDLEQRLAALEDKSQEGDGEGDGDEDSDEDGDGDSDAVHAKEAGDADLVGDDGAEVSHVG